MTLKEYYGTLSETINALVAEGYTLDFNVKEECLVCNKTNLQLSPDEFQIDKLYRFEGMTDPDDQAILYAISSEEHNVKGLLVNGYGITADEYSSRMVSKLNTHQDNEAAKFTHNDSTTLRPEGGRTLFAPLVEMDLPEFISQIKSEVSWTEKDHNSITIYKSDSLRIVLMGFHKGAKLIPHKANGVISLQVISGSIEFTARDKTVTINKDQMIALDEGIMHDLTALSESFVLLTLAKASDKTTL